MLAAATGRVNSHTAALTSMDQANSGTSRRLIPAGRSEITVAARFTAPASSEAMTSPVPRRVRVMASRSAPVTPSSAPQPPPANTDTATISDPISHDQNEA